MKNAYPVTKSKAAFLMTCESLFDKFPRIYFWTFTFIKCQPDWWYPLRWNEFQTEINRNYGGRVQGVRVIEVHPGEYSHGLHYHALFTKRYNWHIIKRIAKRFDIGRLSVEIADRNTMHYLAKYMTKENDLSPGMRKWATLGGFVGTKVRNVACDSEFARNIQYCQEAMNGAQFTYAFFLYLSKLTIQFGEISNWPKVKRLNIDKPENWQSEKVKSIENRELEKRADDDGRYDKTKLEMVPMRAGFKTIKIKTEYGWCDQLIPAIPNKSNPY